MRHVFMVAFLYVACAPHVTPEQCVATCNAFHARVCEYSDDYAGQGLCVCSDEFGKCPEDKSGDGGHE